MNRPSRTLLVACAVAVPLSLAVAGCGGDDDKIESDSVANVDGTQITKTQYENNLKFQNVLASQQAMSGKLFDAKNPKLVSFKAPYTECIAAVKKQVPKDQKVTDAQLKDYCVSTEKALKEQAVGQLVTSQYLIGEAKKDEIKVSDAEIKKQLDAKLTQTIGGKKNLPKFTALTGLDQAPFLEQIKIELIGQKIQAKITKDAGKVTDADIQAYYDKNKAQYTQPETRNLRIILTKTEAQAEAAKKAVEGGENFAAVAKKSSIDPVTKKNGGKLDNVFKGQQEKALEAASFKAKKGEVVGPIKTETGYYVVRVEKVTPSKVVPFKDVKAQIKQQLETQKPQEALTKWQTDVLKDWQAKTNCREGYVIQYCKNAPKPKTDTAAAATTATPQQ